jgi:hypothetical protein
MQGSGGHFQGRETECGSNEGSIYMQGMGDVTGEHIVEVAQGVIYCKGLCGWAASVKWCSRQQRVARAGQHKG